MLGERKTVNTTPLAPAPRYRKIGLNPHAPVMAIAMNKTLVDRLALVHS